MPRRLSPGFIAGWMILLDYLLIPAFVYVLIAVALETLLPGVDRGVWIIVLVAATTGGELVRHHGDFARQFRRGRAADGRAARVHRARVARAVRRQGQRRADAAAGVRRGRRSTPARSSARPRSASCRSSASMRSRRLPRRSRAAIGASWAARSSRCWCCRRCSSWRLTWVLGNLLPGHRHQGSGGGGV